MLSPVLDGALAGDNSLDVEAEHGEHRKAAVLDFLHLQLSKGVGVVSEAKRVEGLTGVQGVEVLAEGTTVHAVCLSAAHEQNLAAEDGQDRLGVDEVRVAEVVETTVCEDLGASLEPNSLAEGDTGVLLQDLGEDAAERAEHGPASVDQLGLAVSSESLGVGGETGGIPAVVTGELTGEVGRNIALGEGAKPLCAVGACTESVGASCSGRFMVMTFTCCSQTQELTSTYGIVLLQLTASIMKPRWAIQDM